MNKILIYESALSKAAGIVKNNKGKIALGLAGAAIGGLAADDMIKSYYIKKDDEIMDKYIKATPNENGDIVFKGKIPNNEVDKFADISDKVTELKDGNVGYRARRGAVGLAGLAGIAAGHYLFDKKKKKEDKK